MCTFLSLLPLPLASTKPVRAAFAHYQRLPRQGQYYRRQSSGQSQCFSIPNSQIKETRTAIHKPPPHRCHPSHPPSGALHGRRQPQRQHCHLRRHVLSPGVAIFAVISVSVERQSRVTRFVVRIIAGCGCLMHAPVRCRFTLRTSTSGLAGATMLY